MVKELGHFLHLEESAAKCVKIANSVMVGLIVVAIVLHSSGVEFLARGRRAVRCPSLADQVSKL